MGHNFLVDAVLIVFLSLRIQEEIETSQVAKAGIFRKTASLLFSERGEEFVVQVANLPLRDGRDRIDWVEPTVESRLLCQLGEASILELTRILNTVDLLDELGPLRHHAIVLIAEIINILVEVFQALVAL